MTDREVKDLYKFSPEELRAIKECNNESFFYRCLPFGTTLGILSYYAVKAGYLKGSKRFGPIPKVLLGATAGYIIGKFSYQKKCAEKIMMLPNSKWGEILRKKKGMSGSPFQEGFSTEPIIMTSPSTLTDDENRNHLDSMQEMRSEDRSYDAPPSAVGLDDTFRPNMDSFSVSDQPLPPPSQVMTSYDELRRQNRDEFEQKRTEAYRRSSTPADPRPPRAPENRTPIRGSDDGKKNAYGDVWAE